jgi:hypothetical protein
MVLWATAAPAAEMAAPGELVEPGVRNPVRVEVAESLGLARQASASPEATLA